MTERIFIDQVSDLVRELESLRNQNASQANTIGMLKEQYDELAAQHLEAVNGHEAKISALRIERDKAVRKAEEVNAILLAAAHATMAGLRAMKGDEQPPAPLRFEHRDRQATPSQRLLDAL